MKEYNFTVQFGGQSKTIDCPFRNGSICNIHKLQKIEPYDCYGTAGVHCDVTGDGVIISARTLQLHETNNE